MFKQYLIFLFGLCTAFSSQGQVDPTSYPDVVKIDPPIVSIRNMLTGEPLRNEQYPEDEEKDNQWQIVDIKAPEFASERDNGTFVQFRVVGKTDRCFGFQRVTTCSDLPNTVYSLIPTDTGAIAIKDAVLGFCFTSNDYRDYNLAPCGRSLRNRELDQSHLWTFTPPFGASSQIRVNP